MFTFLNSLLLPALALALLPIIIHLMNRKKTKRVLFSSLEFLKSLQKNKMKRLKIRQIVLLILRSAILLLAVLAFTRPVSLVSDRGDITSHHETSVILILDNSMSSGYVSEKGAIMDRIKDKAMQILDYLKEGDEAVILTVDDRQGVEFSRNFSELKARVRSLSARHERLDLTEALHRATVLTQSARHPNLEIYVLSDMQASAFQAEPAAFLPEASFQPIFISFAVDDAGNTSVRNASVVSRIAEHQKPLKIEATVRQDGQSRGESLLTLFLDGRRAGQMPTSLTDGPDEKNISFNASAKKSGFVTGFVESEDDPLMADNRFYFHKYVPREVQVLLIGPSGKDTEILRLALVPSPDFPTTIRVTETTPQQFLSLNPTDFHVAVFSNLPSFSEAMLQRLESFVRGGGGVIFFPGSQLDMAAYNSGVMARLGLGRVLESSPHGATGMRFDRVDGSHPVLSGLFETPNKDIKIESPNVYQSVKVLASPTAVVPITLSDRSPFLVENRLGQGTAFFFATAVDLHWSDLALKGIFPPLLNRCVMYLATFGRGEEANFRTGEPIEVTQRNISAEHIRVTGPSGEEIIPKVRMAGPETVLRIPEVDVAGCYLIWHRDEVVNVIDVNVPAEESELKTIASGGLDTYFGAGDYRVISEDENIEEFILQSRFGREWWKWLLATVLLMAIVEIAVAQSHRFRSKIQP